MDLDDAADELYALPPEEFTAARKVKVAEARKAGDRQLAKEIGELRRPTVSAATVNQLTRRRPELIDDLLALGDEMRQAQAALAAGDLRKLSARRHEVVSSLVDEGRRLAAEQQHPLTAAGESELTATLQAALADPDAAGAVRSGRLTSALQYSGFGTVTGDLVARPAKRPTEKPAPPKKAALRLVPEPPPEEPRREEATAAKEAMTAARGRLDEVEQAASRADEAVAEVQRRRQEATERISELERQMTQARDDERQAVRVLRTQEKARDRSARVVEAARRRVEQAQQALDRRKSR